MTMKEFTTCFVLWILLGPLTNAYPFLQRNAKRHSGDFKMTEWLACQALGCDKVGYGLINPLASGKRSLDLPSIPRAAIEDNDNLRKILRTKFAPLLNVPSAIYEDKL